VRGKQAWGEVWLRGWEAGGRGAHLGRLELLLAVYGVEMASSNLGMDGKNLSWNLHARSRHTTAHSSARSSMTPLDSPDDVRHT